MFLNVKYTKWYYRIIANAQQSLRTKGDGAYYESHHIVPKSMGGCNKKSNLVLLTAKEHFICHLLLCRMVGEEYRYKMLCAFYQMRRRGKNQTERIIHSKMYDRLKNEFSVEVSKRMKGKPKSDLHRQRMSVARKGIKLSEEHRFNVSKNHHNVSGEANPRYGVTVLDSTKEKISKAMKGRWSGEKNPNFGKSHSEETKRLIALHSKNKWTDEMRERSRQSRIRNRLLREEQKRQSS